MKTGTLREEPCGTTLYVHKDRIIIPKVMVSDPLTWYHSSLLHPGVSCMRATLKKHFYWKRMDKNIEDLVRTCPVCQRCKKIAVRPVGHLPLRGSRSVVPWERIHVDCIGPWTINIKILKDRKTINRKVTALTMICEASL